MRDICTTLHHILSVVDDVVAAEAWRKLYEESAATASPRPRQKGLAGLGAAVAPEPEPTSPPLAPQLLPPSRLTRLQVADAFLETAGFALHAAPSSIKHEDSGTGLWLRGSVGVGQLVGLYPGVSYGPEYHRQIPGYPLVARTNPYLLARFDGVVLDAKPWGAGREGGSREEEGAEKSGSGWPQEPANAAEAQLALLEGRNPVALAHLANHPPSGTQPNVMVAALDWEPPPEVAPELRAYFPVIDYGQAHTDSAAARRRIPGVALVATRDISDEELFLNYRLNPNAPAGLPSWYSPVDGAEDDRRWA